MSTTFVAVLLVAGGLLAFALISQRRPSPGTPGAGTGADVRSSIALIADSARSVAEVVGGFGEGGGGAGSGHGGRTAGGGGFGDGDSTGRTQGSVFADILSGRQG